MHIYICMFCENSNFEASIKCYHNFTFASTENARSILIDILAASPSNEATTPAGGILLDLYCPSKYPTSIPESLSGFSSPTPNYEINLSVCNGATYRILSSFIIQNQHDTIF